MTLDGVTLPYTTVVHGPKSLSMYKLFMFELIRDNSKEVEKKKEEKKKVKLQHNLHFFQGYYESIWSRVKQKSPLGHQMLSPEYLHSEHIWYFNAYVMGSITYNSSLQTVIFSKSKQNQKCRI